MLKDCKGQPIVAGEKLLLTRNGVLIVASLVKETSESYVLTGRVRLPKYVTRYDFIQQSRWRRVNISGDPYLAILKVEDSFSL